MRVAVIGGGAAGLSAAWRLSTVHEVMLYEASDILGGHAKTIDFQGDHGVQPADFGLPDAAFGRYSPLGWARSVAVRLIAPRISPYEEAKKTIEAESANSE